MSLACCAFFLFPLQVPLPAMYIPPVRCVKYFKSQGTYDDDLVRFLSSPVRKKKRCGLQLWFGLGSYCRSPAKKHDATTNGCRALKIAILGIITAHEPPSHKAILFYFFLFFFGECEALGRPDYTVSHAKPML
jgi:hypothetical protein